MKEKYIGCFVDTVDRDLPKYYGVLKSHKECFEKVAKDHFKFSSL